MAEVKIYVTMTGQIDRRTATQKQIKHPIDEHRRVLTLSSVRTTCSRCAWSSLIRQLRRIEAPLYVFYAMVIVSHNLYKCHIRLFIYLFRFVAYPCSE